MTQTVSPASGTATGNPVPAPAVATAPQAGLSTPSGRADGPRLMRRLRTLVIIVMLVVAAASALFLNDAQAKLDGAGMQTRHYQRLLEAQTQLLRADAQAGLLLLEKDTQQANLLATGYRSSIDKATSLIVEAAAAQPTDASGLGAVMSSVMDYTVAVENARAKPVAANQTSPLVEASRELRTAALPRLAALAEVSQNRAERHDEQLSVLLLLVLWVAAAMLVLVAFVIARRTHRYLNLGLVGALFAVGLSIFMAGSTVSGLGGATHELVTSDLVNTRAAAQVRLFASEAQANQHIAIVARDPAAADAWNGSLVKAQQALSSLPAGDRSALASAFQAYTNKSEPVDSSIRGSDWTNATRLVLTTADNSVAESFSNIDTQAVKLLESYQAGTDERIDGFTGRVVAMQLLTLLACILGAALGVWGINQRLKEYG